MAITNYDQTFVGSDELIDEDVFERERRLRHRLEVQTGQIEKVFAHNQLPVEVTGGAIGSGAFRYEMKAHLHDGLERLRLVKDDLINALGVSDVRLNREDGRLKVSVGRKHPHAVDLLDLHAMRPDEQGVSAILGLDYEGKMILLNLADRELGNILISGASAAGKSGLLRTFAVSLALANRQSQVQIGVLSSPSSRGGFISRPNLIQPLSFLPHVLFPVVSSAAETVEALQFLADELTYREETGLDWPLLVILIDNADVLLESGDYALSSLLTRLATASPLAGVRLVVSATNPNAGDLGRIFKHNVSLRLTGRTVRQRNQRRIDDSNNLNGQGDFLAESYGTSIHFQAAFIDDYDLHLTLEGLHQRQNVLLAQPQDRINSNDDLNESNNERSFAVNNVKGEIILDQESAEEGQIVEVSVEEEESVELLRVVEPVNQKELLPSPAEDLDEPETIEANIVRLGAGGSAGGLRVVKVRASEPEYSDFEDDWRVKNEDDGNESFRHFH